MTRSVVLLALLGSVAGADPVPAPAAAPGAAAHPLFTARAARRATVRPTAAVSLASTLDADVTLTSLAAGVLLADGLVGVGLAVHDLRSRRPGPDASESAQVVTLRAGLDWPLDPAHALSLPVYAQLGAGPDQASYLGADAGLAIHAGRLALAVSVGLLRTSLHVIDDPVPVAAVTLSWGTP